MACRICRLYADSILDETVPRADTTFFAPFSFLTTSLQPFPLLLFSFIFTSFIPPRRKVFFYPELVASFIFHTSPPPFRLLNFVMFSILQIAYLFLLRPGFSSYCAKQARLRNTRTEEKLTRNGLQLCCTEEPKMISL